MPNDTKDATTPVPTATGMAFDHTTRPGFRYVFLMHAGYRRHHRPKPTNHHTPENPGPALTADTSPLGDGCTASFSNIVYAETTLTDLRDGR